MKLNTRITVTPEVLQNLIGEVAKSDNAVRDALSSSLKVDRFGPFETEVPADIVSNPAHLLTVLIGALAAAKSVKIDEMPGAATTTSPRLQDVTTTHTSPVRGKAPELSNRDRYGALQGSNNAMRVLYAILEKIEHAPKATVLIQGESGVGKELVAAEIHKNSPRTQGAFEVCDCAALNSNLIESTLFGHERGAFTGADRKHIGVFERADGGTIFLDEIGELPLEMQTKLLRVLESRRVCRVGAQRSEPVNVRVIAATNRDLRVEVKEGRFREDLYHRLNVVKLNVPPLRDRRTDVPDLIRSFVEKEKDGKVELPPETLDLLSNYDWPGNVRELKNAVASIAALGELPEEIFGAAEALPATSPAEVDFNLSFKDAKRLAVTAFEQAYLNNKLHKHKGNVSQAAKDAKMERRQFGKLLKQHKLK